MYCSYCYELENAKFSLNNVNLLLIFMVSQVLGYEIFVIEFWFWRVGG